jgi:transcriptional regulator with XRE-family HTH domain
MYLCFMATKKPGPPKGQSHKDVKRSTFGGKLFEVRRRKGLTQKQLGEKIGVSKRVVAFYEGDTEGPPPDLLKKIADALGVTVSYLVGESPIKQVGVDLKPTVRRYVSKLQKLPQKQQQTAFRIIDALAAESGIATDTEDEEETR